MPRGGSRQGAGRKKGSKCKVTADIRAAAQEYGQEALDKLIDIMRNGTYQAVQITAAKEILDRAYGKAKITGEISVVRETVDFTDAELAAIAAASRNGAAQSQESETESPRLH